MILTEHLRIHATGADVAIAQANASTLEAIYAETYTALGLALEAETGTPDGRLLVILAEGNEVVWSRTSGRVALPSPGYLVAGETWNGSDLLRQGWQAALLDQAIWEAGAVHRIPAGWLPILHGTRLWLLWDGDGPLAHRRWEIVAWLARGDGSLLPDATADELCRVYALWDRSPLDYSVPVGCRPTQGAALPSPSLVGDLSSLGLPSDPSSPEVQSRLMTNQARNVALAVVLEYAAEEYGRQAIPGLLAALQDHDSWQTLIPAVFDVSIETFEAG